MLLLSPNMSRLLLLCHFPSRFLALVVTLLPLIKWLSRRHYVIPTSCSVLLQMQQTYDSLLWPLRPCRSGRSLELCFLAPIHSSPILVLVCCFSNVTSMFSSQASALSIVLWVFSTHNIWSEAWAPDNTFQAGVHSSKFTSLTGSTTTQGYLFAALIIFSPEHTP